MGKNRRRLAAATMAMAMLTLMMSPAQAVAPVKTSGAFETFADGGSLGYEVGGHALMIRTASRTIVVVHASGLLPGETYGSHVHKQACDDGSAGGHYSFGYPVHGGALDGTEIWPGPLTANEAGRAVGVAMVGATAGPEAVSVVIHAPSGSKIACADLA